MKKFSEYPFTTQLAVMVAVAAVIVVAGEMLYLNDMRTANNDLTQKIAAQKAENDKVRGCPESSQQSAGCLDNRLKELKADTERLEQQLATLRTIVPEEKEADAFIRMVQEAGVQSGINIRRFTARAAVQREFYVEVPFDLSLDGTYHTVLQFFDRLSRLSRIINVTNLAIGPTSRSVRGVGQRYAYSPSETVLASCTATTFFSREAQPVKK